jgi:hypothetical protein
MEIKIIYILKLLIKPGKNLIGFLKLKKIYN